MKLVCPKCQYSKELDDAVIPAEMVYATCPQCSQRFRFRGVETDAGVVEDQADRPVAHSELATEASKEGAADTPKVNSVRFAARQNLPQQDTETAADGVNSGVDIRTPDAKPYAPASDALHDHVDTGPDGVANAAALPNIPWAHRGSIGLPAAFMATVRDVLLNPAVFFARAGGEWRKVGVIPFYVFCTAFGMFVAQVWAWAIMTFLGDVLSDTAVIVSGGEFSGWGSALLLTVATAILSPLLLLVSAGILHGCLRLVGAARGGFGATAMVCGFAICANVLYMVPFIGQILAALWGLFVILVGIKHAHKTQMWRVVVALVLPFVFLLLLIVVAGILNR